MCYHPPGKDKEANWRPTPDGTVFLAMRLYWPSTEGKSILPPGKAPGNQPAL